MLAPITAKASQAPQPEDLLKGTLVIYNGDQRGVITDAFAPLNQFWVADEKSNELIRDEEGNIIAFSAQDLLLAPPPGKRPGPAEGGTQTSRVLVMGTEAQMLQVLEHFGAPDATERREPQQLLAVPCNYAQIAPSPRFDPKRSIWQKEECPLLSLCRDGIDDAMLALSRRLRPDIQVEVRASYLKQALEQLGPDLKKLENYYILSAVSLPYGKKDIAVATGWEKYWKKEVRCQIDIDVSAEGPKESGEASLEDTAKRALGEACGICFSDYIWSEEAQFKLRQKLHVDIPLKFWDGQDTKISVVILPEDATSSSMKDLLMFTETSREATASNGKQASLGGKTIAEWREDQEQFKDLPKLPEGWIRIRSRTNAKEIYYWDTKTNKASYEVPLPPGWTKQKSKSTGQVYYFNAKRRKSTFEIPTE